MTTAQPGQNSEDFLRALLKKSSEPAEKSDDQAADGDNEPRDNADADAEDGEGGS